MINSKSDTQTNPKEGNDIKLDSIESAIEDIKAGKIIIVVDDEDRENEGDFICAAEKITPELVNFMATYGRGLLCTPITSSKAKELNLTMMVDSNTALHETAFTVSIDLIGQGCSTGISAYDRSTGINWIANDDVKAEDFARPGHIFPLIAKDGGVLRRTGHTEAAVDLSVLAGLKPVGALIEILNEDGSMARLPQLKTIADQHDLKIISIKDLVAYRMENERIIEPLDTYSLETDMGKFEVHPFRQITSDDIHLAIVKGDVRNDDECLVRVHSSSQTNDIIGVIFQGQAELMQQAIAKIGEQEKGVFLYMRDGEKEDNILAKLDSITKNRGKQNTTDKEVQRDFGVGAQILHHLGVRKIKLLTNNPKKRVGLLGYGLEIVEEITLS